MARNLQCLLGVTVNTGCQHLPKMPNAEHSKGRNGVNRRGWEGKSNDVQKIVMDKDLSALLHSPSSCHCCLANVLGALNTKVSLSAIDIKSYVTDF